jgi:carbonic anhydrase/acetyltransferase-like protein (isoleucine patch superfamily)
VTKGWAVILRTDTVIAPFGDPVAEAFMSGESLAETQDRALRAAGLAVQRAASTAEAAEAIQRAPKGRPVLLLLDRIFISEKAVRDFLRAAKAAPRPASLALLVNASVEYTLPLQDVRREGDRVVHDVVLVDGATLPPPSPDPVGWLHAIRDSAQPVLVPMREIAVQVPLPVIGEGPRPFMRYPVTSTVVVSLEHWVHVLWLNQIAFGIRWMELLRRRPLWALFRALSAGSLDFDRIRDRFVARGRGARIHPSASISTSILGPRVQIGAHATVRNSIVGEGAILQDHAVLLNSVVGPGCLVTENTALVSSVAYPEATIGNYKLSVCLIGRGAYVNAWAGFIDARFRDAVKVNHKGALVSSERAFLGSVVGHRAKVAAKVLIHPGREIPNDTVIVMRPDEVVSLIPKDLPAGRPVVRDHGTLVPLGQEGHS